ncbi:hypothetical protein ACFWWM_00350 [Streptomyces sp. NPDC058682]|uniref:hypothetical protein n=1 Tax=Streptomyces sp. NPDC058682 TaxID=3346596 RepID=UPI00366995BC
MNFIKIPANGMFWTVAVQERRTFNRNGRTVRMVFGRWYVPGAGWTAVPQWHTI